MGKRTDVHRPSALVTEDYEFVGCGDYGDFATPSWSPLRQGGMGFLVHDEGWKFGGVNGGACDHCGAYIRYYAILKHVPSHTLITVGETCLDNRFERSSVEFHALRKQAQLDREAHAIKNAWTEYQTTHVADWEALFASTNDFVQDVLRKGRTYGTLSDRQFEAIVKAVERENAPAAPAEPTVPVPEGRVVITGQVVSVKLKDGYYGETWKMLVKVDTDAGSYKVWGTVPTALWHQIRFAVSDLETPAAHLIRTQPTVTFSATVERSADDESFGFFKRPAKIQVHR